MNVQTASIVVALLGLTAALVSLLASVVQLTKIRPTVLALEPALSKKNLF